MDIHRLNSIGLTGLLIVFDVPLLCGQDALAAESSGDIAVMLNEESAHEFRLSFFTGGVT